MSFQGQLLQSVSFCHIALCSPNMAIHSLISVTSANGIFSDRNGTMGSIHGLKKVIGKASGPWTSPTILQFVARPSRCLNLEMRGKCLWSRFSLSSKKKSIYCSSAKGRVPIWWSWRRVLSPSMAAQGSTPASQPNGVGDVGTDGAAGVGIQNSNGLGFHTEPAKPLLKTPTSPGDLWGWRNNGSEGSSDFGEPAIAVDLLEEERVAALNDGNEFGDLGMPDIELEKIAESISTIERRNEFVVQEMIDFTRVLADTAKALSARAQVARIEAAKLKKIARLQLAEDVRRSQELRKAIDLRRVEEKRLEEIRCEQQHHQRALNDAIKAASGIASGAGNAEMMEALAPSAALAAAYGVVSMSTGTAPDVGPLLVDTFSSARCYSDNENEGDVLGPDTVTMPESLECTVTHPGALSCTKTTVRKDATRKMASVTMSVTTRCEGDACHSNALDVDDYVALSVQTLVEMAHEMKQSRCQRTTDADPVVYEKHRSIVDILRNGLVVSAKPNEPPSKFGHESFVVKLVDPRTGHEIDAMFKPRVEGDADGWHRAPIEYVAYELNLMLGMDYVPPVTYRKGGVALGDRQFEEGAFIYYVPRTKPLKRVAAASWGVSVARLLSDTRILDVLLNNSDRHHGHFLYGDHWADGKPRPILIDHAAGFRKEAVVAMDHENAFQTGPVRCVAAKTYLRLRFLEQGMVASKFSKDLSGSEISALMERRDQILAYLDQLVKERGYHRTVIEV